MNKLALSTIMLTALSVGSSAQAAPFVVNSSLTNIGTAFDNVVTAAGSTVTTAQVVANQNSYNYIDKDGNNATVTVTRPNGGTPSSSSGYSSGGTSLSGAVWNINPSSSVSDPVPGFGSGLKFTFSSPVNAFGFEIGDWATCCMSGTRPGSVQSTYSVPAQGSGLWIGFDGGALTLPANALSANDNPGYAESFSFTNFIGAIDSTADFSEVIFFGDGFGEFLVAGGTLRFASVPKGSVDQGGAVPEPSMLALIGLSLLGFGSVRRNKRV